MTSPPQLRLIFCGTPSFAVPSLRHLLAQPDFEVAAVITQPDRPRGRGQEISHSAVKEAALAAGVPVVYQPEKIRAAESEEFLRRIQADVIVIIAYGQIIPARLLGIPRFGWINLHASLLPKYRGAAPIQWAIANGETITGVTSMRIDAGMDTGDMLLQAETAIAPDETAPQLAARLAELGAPLMVETLRRLRDAAIAPRPQDHSAATLAPLLKKEDGRIEWSLTASAINHRMRGFNPWPGAYTQFRGVACQLFGAPVSNDSAPSIPSDAAPGTILSAGDALFVLCGQKTLLALSRVKMEGRKEVSASEFARGAHLQSGERFA